VRPPCQIIDILFIFRGSIPVRLIRNPRGTNWGYFKEGSLERGPAMDMKVRLGWGLRFIGYSRPSS
jgi:hypothetical protein